MTYATIRARAEYDQLLAEMRGMWKESSADSRALLSAVALSTNPLVLTALPPVILHGMVKFAIVSMMQEPEEEQG